VTNLRAPLKVWIVEDLPDFAAIAWKFVEQVRHETHSEADLFWIDSFKWPPRLHESAAVGSVMRGLSDDDYPDIVVLDLCMGDALEGNGFLGSLRKWEKAAERRRSFVLFWSEYSSTDEVRDFVNQKVKEDLRTLPVVKSPHKGPGNALLGTILDTWRLIEEERDA
jgi:hypothetical protein